MGICVTSLSMESHHKFLQSALERPQLRVLALVLALLLCAFQSHQQNLGVPQSTVFPVEAEVSPSSAQVCICISVQHGATKSGLEHRLRRTPSRQMGEP